MEATLGRKFGIYIFGSTAIVLTYALGVATGNRAVAIIALIAACLGYVCETCAEIAEQMNSVRLWYTAHVLSGLSAIALIAYAVAFLVVTP